MRETVGATVGATLGAVAGNAESGNGGSCDRGSYDGEVFVEGLGLRKQMLKFKLRVGFGWSARIEVKWALRYLQRSQTEG